MTYTIAKVAKRFNLTAHTLRYYDKEGLLPFVDRGPSGVRKFKEDDMEWLVIINCLKETGMSIKDIKTFIDWCLQGDDTIEQRLQMFKAQKEKVEKQMKELKTHLDKINFKIWYYQKAKDAGTLDIHKELDKECINNEINKTKRQ